MKLLITLLFEVCSKRELKKLGLYAALLALAIFLAGCTLTISSIVSVSNDGTNGLVTRELIIGRSEWSK